MKQINAKLAAKQAANPKIQEADEPEEGTATEHAAGKSKGSEKAGSAESEVTGSGSSGEQSGLGAGGHFDQNA